MVPGLALAREASDRILSRSLDQLTVVSLQLTEESTGGQVFAFNPIS
jgi:hypothetical protein